MSELPLSDQAIVRLADRVAARHPDDVALLERLVRIPSVSGPDPDSEALARSAQAVADELDAARLDWVRIVDGAHGTPSVIGERRGPVGAPAVLLYAHHDVQPAGEESAWTTAPFQPTLRDGRLYGRGAADDKAGIVVHSAAVRALGSELPVTVRVLIDGAEEVGSPQLGDLLEAHAQHLTADVIIVADLVNAAPGHPALTTSLRGIADLDVTVQVAGQAAHSGIYGGLLPDALTALARLLASLHHDDGSVAVSGLTQDSVPVGAPPGQVREEAIRAETGAVDGLRLLGTGELERRLWTLPAINVLGIQAPGLDKASHAIVPRATARVSVRLAPSQDPNAALGAVQEHLRCRAPWGVQVDTRPVLLASGYRCDLDSPAAALAGRALTQGFGTAPVAVGVGGGLPVNDAIRAQFPHAEVLLTAVADPGSGVHGPNESVLLDDLRRAATAETLLLASLGAIP